MINAKKTFFMLTACTVLAVTISASTFSAPRVMIAQEATGKEPLQIAQTETSGVSLSMKTVSARAGDVGAQEVTAQLDPANAICDLEWSLSVVDTEFSDSDMSDYLTIEEKSATSIEITCHQRYDGFVELHVEDLLTGKTASASVTAWTFFATTSDDGEGGNYDFSINTTGQTSWTLSGSAPTGQFFEYALLDDWYFATSILSLSNGRVTATQTADGLVLSYGYTSSSGNSVALVRQPPKTMQGGVAYPALYPGDKMALIAEVDRKPDAICARYSEYEIEKEWYYDGVYVCYFEVKDSDIHLGISYTHAAMGNGTQPFTVTVKSIQTYKYYA